MDKKLVMVLGGGLLVGVGVFVWYFFVGNAAVQRDAAKKPIAQWEKEWRAARACLLGDQPTEADPTDELTLRAMRGDQIHCALSELGRPEGQGSGIDEIEDAWGEIETAWHALAKAVPHADEMGPQITALDHALEKLHHGAGLDPPELARGTHTIADLKIGAPIAGTKGFLFTYAGARSHALIGTIDDRTVIVRDATSVTVRPPIAEGVVAVVGEPTWGATAATDDKGAGSITAGPLAATGAITAPVPVAKSKYELSVVAAAGHDVDRVILLAENTPDIVLLETTTSHDSGAHWSKPEVMKGGWSDRLLVDEQNGALAMTGTPQPATGELEDAEAAWLTAGDAGHAQIVTAAARPDDGRTCFAGTLWYGSEDDESQLAWMKSTDVHIPITLGGRVQPLACTKDAVAVSTGLEYQ
ncbi:MAG TPA: hypothetical protein VL463_12985, partial [Kofleriaceae bacterium]|nr:hypothetical protein [Kofleriaceae bacterium]